MRDPLKFPDLNHVVKRDPRTNMASPANNWDWWSLLPESLHQVTITMSDRGIPASYRHMHGYGSHTFSLINADGQRHWVKFHHRSQQGIKNLTDAEASAVGGQDLDSNQRDLLEAIDRRDVPRWKLYVQVMPEADAATLPYNPFDLTKVWPQGDYPLIEVGEWELNRNPENYFAEVEQAAFAPSRVVPGIGFSPDKMLQGRLFSYLDAQYYRLGVNHQTIPVNAPRCPVHSYHRDGAMRVDGNYGATLHYEPNSYGQWQEQPDYRTPSEPLGDVASWDWNFRDDDYYTQPPQPVRATRYRTAPSPLRQHRHRPCTAHPARFSSAGSASAPRSTPSTAQASRRPSTTSRRNRIPQPLQPTSVVRR